MKKLSFLIFIVFALFTTSSFAQIRKGAIFLGGDIGGSTQKTSFDNTTNTDKQNSFYLSPVFGKAIKENLVFGAKATFSIFNDKTTAANTESKQNSYGMGIFIRKYKTFGKSGFSIFAEGNLGYSYFNSTVTPLTSGFTNDKRNTFSINIVPGFSYTLTRKLQLETGLANLLLIDYFTEKRDIGDIVPTSSKTNGFNIGSSIDNLSSLYVGFRLLIN